MKQPRHVVIVGFDDAEMLDIACPSDAMDAANRLGAARPYRVELASLGGRPVRCSSGLVLVGQVPLEKVSGPLDTLVVAGGLGHGVAAANGRLLAEVRRLSRASRRIASVCTGAHVLAAAGLLNGRRATTHWSYAGRMAAAYTSVTVDPAPLYIKDGNVYTSAGVTSALDLTLALIEEDNGAELARSVARTLVTYLQRPGNQAQVSVPPAAPLPEHRMVRTVVTYISNHLSSDLSAPTLARVAGVSQRHLTRLFDGHLGTSPARYVRVARTEAAAQLLVQSSLPLTAVARKCGFTSTETLRQAFSDLYATSPSAYRNVNRRSSA
ncbi:AraC family transcriptional regulator [Wenjunlia vitaminophila]|uniref:AraC family transcriptional regulator n=1 Tax=Wenjunlia vitaminophila TaxID=76728 RepID=A0A0T6LZS3_WENVI|nr:GlxA family transcriptional regulator [Wenjunlia vitaminophila]KRV51494.1 AraC family transcriptional regulator [Wenjunlia vitaminophila]